MLPAGCGCDWGMLSIKFLENASLEYEDALTVSRVIEVSVCYRGPHNMLTRSSFLEKLKRVRFLSAQRGTGVRGEHTAGCSRECCETLIQSGVAGVEAAEMYPPSPPAPLPRWGEGCRTPVCRLFASYRQRTRLLGSKRYTNWIPTISSRGSKAVTVRLNW